MNAIVRLWRYIKTGRDPKSEQVDERIDDAMERVTRMAEELKNLNSRVTERERHHDEPSF